MTRRLIALALFAVCALSAQPAEKKLSFEVATVKAAPTDAGGAYQEGFRMGRASRGLIIEGRRASVTYNTLRDLVRVAYGLKDHQVVAPDWMASQRFDVAATLPEGADAARAPEMLQALLEERFHLATHEEPKEMPVLALVVAKGGIKAPAAAAPGPASATAGADSKRGAEVAVAVAGRAGSMAFGRPGIAFIRMKAATLGAFADRLISFTDRPVIDLTELGGTYDFDVTFAREDSDTAPTLFTALQEKLGLKLEARKAKVKTLVVDRADKLPAEN